MELPSGLSGRRPPRESGAGPREPDPRAETEGPRGSNDPPTSRPGSARCPPPRRSDPFPSTPITWLTAVLGDPRSPEGGRSLVNEYIMRLYARPLRRYFDFTRERWLRNGTEVVHGFFADRLDRPDFFVGWQASGKPLRDWLKNAFSFYLKEECRRRQREARIPDGRRLTSPVPSPNPEEEFDRAYAQELVREALEQTRHECERASLSLHWRVFHEHFYRQVPYSECAPALGLTEEQAAVKARAAVRRFRAAVRELLARDGLTPGQIDREILALLEVTR